MKIHNCEFVVNCIIISHCEVQSKNFGWLCIVQIVGELSSLLKWPMFCLLATRLKVRVTMTRLYILCVYIQYFTDLHVYFSLLCIFMCRRTWTTSCIKHHQETPIHSTQTSPVMCSGNLYLWDFYIYKNIVW